MKKYKNNFIFNSKSLFETAFYYFFLFIITFIVVDISPTLISSLQPDSYTYIEFDQTRTSVYPSFISLSNFIEIDLIFLQKIFFSISIVFLIYALKSKNIENSIILLFYIFLVSNVFYTTFSKIVLTESLFFTFINLSFAILILGKKDNHALNFFFGTSIGLIIATKSIGLAIGVPLILVSSYIYYRSNKFYDFFTIFFGLVTVIIFENYFYYKKHTERMSVLPISITGKLILLSGKDSFNIKNYSETHREILKNSKKTFEPVVKFLENIQNPLLRSDLMADYEVVAQYQILKKMAKEDFDIDKLKDVIGNAHIHFTSTDELFYQLLKNNLKDYLILSSHHYIGMWSTNSKEIFLNNYLKNKSISQPLLKEFNNASSGVKEVNIKILILAQLFFFVLFLSFIFFTFITFFLFFTKKFFDNYNFALPIIISQFYLVLVSLSNVATVRYLMPIYPLILLSMVFFISLVRENIKLIVSKE